MEAKGLTFFKKLDFFIDALESTDMEAIPVLSDNVRATQCGYSCKIDQSENSTLFCYWTQLSKRVLTQCGIRVAPEPLQAVSQDMGCGTRCFQYQCFLQMWTSFLLEIPPFFQQDVRASFGNVFVFSKFVFVFINTYLIYNPNKETDCMKLVIHDDSPGTTVSYRHDIEGLDIHGNRMHRIALFVCRVGKKTFYCFSTSSFSNIKHPSRFPVDDDCQIAWIVLVKYIQVYRRHESKGFFEKQDILGGKFILQQQRQ